MNIEFIEGEAPSNQYGELEGEYIIKTSDGRLHAVGLRNAAGGVCACCRDDVPPHVAYFRLGDSE